MVPALTPLAKVMRDKKAVLRQVAKHVEADHSHLSRVVNGRTQASPSLAKKLAEYFGGAITRDQILFPEEYTTRAKKPSRSVELQEAL